MNSFVAFTTRWTSPAISSGAAASQSVERRLQRCERLLDLLGRGVAALHRGCGLVGRRLHGSERIAVVAGCLGTGARCGVGARRRFRSCGGLVVVIVAATRHDQCRGGCEQDQVAAHGPGV